MCASCLKLFNILVCQKLNIYDVLTYVWQVDSTAAGLLTLGVRRGDRVGIFAPNVPEWLFLQFATAKVGAIMVNVNPAYTAGELQFALHQVCRWHFRFKYIVLVLIITH